MWVPDIQLNVELLAGTMVAMVSVSPVLAAEAYVFGRCTISTQSSGADIRPVIDGGSYLVDYHGDDPRYKAKLDSGQFFSNAKVTLLKAPEHGDVSLVDTPISNEWYHYMPNNGYVGRDHFVMQVEKDGVKVRIEYLIEGIDDEEAKVRFCEQESWKISSITPNLDNASLQALANAVGINNTYTVNASALTGGAVGQTTGNTITLDTNATGYGWYIDYTPYLDDKYLQLNSVVVSTSDHIKGIT